MTRQRKKGRLQNLHPFFFFFNKEVCPRKHRKRRKKFPLRCRWLKDGTVEALHPQKERKTKNLKVKIQLLLVSHSWSWCATFHELYKAWIIFSFCSHQFLLGWSLWIPKMPNSTSLDESCRFQSMRSFLTQKQSGAKSGHYHNQLWHTTTSAFWQKEHRMCHHMCPCVERTVCIYVYIFFWLFFSFFAEGKYMPLGGQHICAALLKLRDYHLKQGCSEAQLPASLRYIKVTTYTSNTSVAVWRSIARRHQATQHDVKESNIAESLSFLVTMAK